MAQSWTAGVKTSLPGASYTHLMWTDRRDLYLNQNLVKELYGEVTPFITFAAKLATVKTKDPDFKCFEHRGKWINMTGYVHDACDWSGASSREVADIVLKDSGDSTNCAYITVGDILEFRCGTAGTRADASGTNHTCVANDILAVAIVVDYDTTNGADLKYLTPAASTIDLADSDPFTIIGNAYNENGRSPSAWSDELETVWNSTQIVKTPLELSGTLMDMTLKGYPREYERLRQDKFREHKMKLNKTALFGWRIDGNASPSTTGHLTDNMGISTDSATQVRTTMGIIPLIKTYGAADKQYFQRQWASYDMNAFLADMEAFYGNNYNVGSELFAFVGYHAMTEMSKVGPDSFLGRSGAAIQLSDPKTTSFGFNVRQLTHPFGTWNLVLDPSFSYYPYTNSMLVVDPDNVQRVVYRNAVYQTNIQDNDRDGRKDQYFTDEGIGVTMVEKHMFLQFN